MIRLITLLLAVSAFSSFAWAAVRVFNIEPTARVRATLVTGGLVVPALVLEFVSLWRSQGSIAYVVAGWLCFMLSLVVFWGALAAHEPAMLRFAFCSIEPNYLTTKGPYRFTRHPIYVAYTLAWVACVLATGRPWLISVAVIMGTVYVHEAAREERAFLKSALAEDYRRYRSRVGMFSPRRMPRARTRHAPDLTSG